MTASDLSYLATSASIIEADLSNVGLALREGSQCVLPASHRGARKMALKIAHVARDRLAALIAELDGEG